MTDAEPTLKPCIRIGISSCLLGQEVRYDGGHKYDPFINETLGRYFEFVPICPEAGVGMGTPREVVQLEGAPDSPVMVGTQTRTDWTSRMNRFAAERVRALGQIGLHGYLLKKNSPSCGMERVRVYRSSGSPYPNGQGLFAEALIKAFPLLPVEEEGRLHDMALRENFVERVFSYHRWVSLRETRPSIKDLVRFHTRHKCSLLAHSPEGYRDLGRLVARAGTLPAEKIFREYGDRFMTALKVRATARKHAKVLCHLIGYLKTAVDSADKAELVDCVETYRQGLIPLIAPITLLLHHFRRHPVDWVMEQTYLHPYPTELMLRNHV